MKSVGDCLGEKLTRIFVKSNTVFLSANNEILVDEIVLVLEESKLRILPIQDTDEISVEVSEYQKLEKSELYSELNILNKYLGSKLSITWNCRNTNNYFDIFIIGLKHLHPSLIILSEGSVLKLFGVEQINK